MIHFSRFESFMDLGLSSGIKFQNALGTINLIFSLILLILYFHQYFYAFLGLITKPKRYKKAKKNHKYAYLISAHNEEIVIGNLVQSIYAQDYPKELMQVFVVADNCNDNTAKVAREAGAIVFERFDSVNKGKSFALDFLIKKIFDEYDNGYEAFFVFDADNLVSKNYTKEMNKVFDEGYKVSTSFRDTKNFDNWISAGASMAFLRECLLIHQSRSILGIGTYISGTGFYVSADILRAKGGWGYHTMTEDIEFSLECALEDIKIAYCADAVFYDEQPSTLKDSLNQRLRWCKGTHQIFAKDCKKIAKKNVKKFSPACFELGMHVSPLPIISFAWFVVYIVLSLLNIIINSLPADIYLAFAIEALLSFCFILFAISLSHAFVVVIRYHKKIKAPLWKQILYCFTFPIYMFFFIPLSYKALFKKVEWVKIKHIVDVKINEMN